MQKSKPFAGAATLAIIALLLVIVLRQNEPADPLPRLALLTSLPLLMPEVEIGELVAGDVHAMPAARKLREHFALIGIDDAKQLADDHFKLALLAQPRAQSPAQLMSLQSWIESGGRAVILADPALQLESRYPLGDSRRPVFTSMLSPLFAHWGLELVLPMDQEKRREVALDGYRLQLAAAGQWQLNSKNENIAQCKIAPDAVLARCAIGKGVAILLADADLLDGKYWQAEGIAAALGISHFQNIDWVVAQLRI